jgi:hypothetical protein
MSLPLARMSIGSPASLSRGRVCHTLGGHASHPDSIVWTDTLPTLFNLGVPHPPSGNSVLLLSGKWMLRKRWRLV